MCARVGVDRIREEYVLGSPFALVVYSFLSYALDGLNSLRVRKQEAVLFKS